jgi:hypothetical protein
MHSDFFPSQQIAKNVRYHAITLTADDDGRIIEGAHTGWVGDVPDDNRFELRGLSEIYPDKMAALWEALKQPYQVVNCDTDFLKWIVNGGHALVQRTILAKFMPGTLEPKRCVKEGYSEGFTCSNLLSKTAFQNAPTPKLRMKVMTRDKRRCLICGQRPSDDPNIVLHAHHIRPFGAGGVTTEKNLITLCHTCHAGLEPHNDSSLYDLISDRGSSKEDTVTRELRKYIHGVMSYQKAFALQFEKHKPKPKGRKKMTES